MDLNKFKCKKYSTVAGEGFCNGCFNETYASHLFVLFAMVREERLGENKLQCFGICIRFRDFSRKIFKSLRSA